MPEPTPDPRILQLVEARLRIAHEPYGSTPNFARLRPDERQLLVDEAATWLRAAIEAGIAPPPESPVEEQPAADVCGKCNRPLEPGDSRLRNAHQPGTSYCRSCVSRCHDSEIADHRCVICA